jgi:tetratricopeptide (TPR) repeat protein
LPPDVPDISEDLLLGRTLLEQGHLGTAQRVLVKLCRQHPDNAEAFRGLGDVLRRKGDEVRARIIGAYAEDLRAPAPGAYPPTPWSEARPVEPKGAQVPGGQKPGWHPAPVLVVSQAELATPRVEIVTPLVELITPEVEIVTPLVEPITPPVVAAAAVTMPSPSQPVALPAGLASTQDKGAAVQTSAAPAAKSGKGKYLAAAAALVLLAGLGILGYRAFGPSERRSFSPREELDSALSSGSLDRLMRARDRARAALAGSEPDPDSLVRLALVDAFLTLDHGRATAKGAEETLRRLRPGDPPNPQLLALAEAARALLALAAGDRNTAKQHVDAGLARAAPNPPPALLLASARVRALAGDTAGAGKDLDRALQAAPDFAPVVAEWAAQRLDCGDATAVRRVTRAFLAKNREASRVQLLAGEAERALGEGGWTKHIEPACHDESRTSRAVRAACWLASAQHARLDGERSAAVRKARAAGQASEDFRVLAESALVLASLGEIDAADEGLARARKLADGKAVPLAWAEMAVRLGRGQTDGTERPAEGPVQPEHHLLALRALYLKGGGAAMAATVKNVPAFLSDFDSDLRTYMELGREGGVSRSDRATLERRAERGSPVAAFVLGVLAARENDHKQAAKWLERALAGHGDACRAALLYLSALQAQDRPGQPNRAALLALHARNEQCPVPEM